MRAVGRVEHQILRRSSVGSEEKSVNFESDGGAADKAGIETAGFGEGREGANRRPLT